MCPFGRWNQTKALPTSLQFVTTYVLSIYYRNTRVIANAFLRYSEPTLAYSIAKNNIEPFLEGKSEYCDVPIYGQMIFCMKIILFVIGILFPLSVQAQVAISEVMWAGTDVSTADEWLIIESTSDTPISLDGWSITKRASDGSQVPMITFEEDVELQPGQRYLISNYDIENSALTVSPDLVTSSVSLTNTKLLLQIVRSDGEVVDTVDDGVGVPFAGSKDPLSVMKRIDIFSPGEEKSNWKSVPLFHSSYSSTSSYSLSLSSSQSSSSSSIPSIIISEILTRPKEGSDYEWIEIANVGEHDVNIESWEIKSGSRSFKIPARNTDGYMLKPNEHTLFFRYQTGLNMPSDDGHIFLFNSDILVDDLPYSVTGEQVSFGRGEDESRELYCIPTPRKKNSKNTIVPKITLQSGRSTDYIKVTVNVKAEADEGSLQSAECFWDFDDGTSSKSCNPPSHSWDNIGVYEVELTVTTMCGDEIVKKLDIVVLPKKKKQSASIISSFKSSDSFRISSSSISSSSSEFLAIEQKMYTKNTTKKSASRSSALLPVRHKNIPATDAVSTDDTVDIPMIYKQVRSLSENKKSDSNATSNGLPWMILFSQSALWGIIAGKKLL